MRVGIVTTWFERGAAYVSKQYASCLKKEHDVFIYARGGEAYARGEENWDQAGVTWGKRPSLSVFTAIDLRDFKKWITLAKLDVILFNEQHWLEPVFLANAMGVLTGSYVDYYTEETVPFFQAYDFLICNTRTHYSVFKWHPQCFYLPWGTDVDLFTPQTFEKVNASRITFFHSAGFNPRRKGTDAVVRSFSKIQEGAHLVIHSQVSLDQFFPALSNQIKNLLAKGCLTVIQKSVPAPGLYHLGDVYVYPSRLDGIGLTIAEALSCGMPVIASNHPPMNEFAVANGCRLVAIERLFSRADGYYWPQCEVDENDLVLAMQEYIDNQDRLAQLKQSARHFAEDELNWHKNAGNLGTIFSNLKKQPEIIKKEIQQAVRKARSKNPDIKADLYLRHPVFYDTLHRGWQLVKKVGSL